MDAFEPILIDVHLPPRVRPARLAGWWNGCTAALACIAALSAGYAAAFRDQPPPPASTIGLGLGSLGFLLMLGAETLCSMRKRVPGFTRGRMSAWLHTHMFLGLLGAFLTLLHSGGRFHGLAGAAVLVMYVVLASGLVGRFLYTAAPRAIDGVEIDAHELLSRFAEAERQWQASGVRLASREGQELLLDPALPGAVAVLARGWLVWRQRRRVARFVRGLSLPERTAAATLRQLLCERYELQLDLLSMAAARRWLSWWHLLHVPLGLVLFTLATIHVAMALRYLAR